MKDSELYNDPEQLFRLAMTSDRSMLWTALPGIVESFDPEAVTVTVQPAIRASVQAKDGSSTSVDLPLLPDVPVVFPGGGGCRLTFPIRAGDECLVIFSSRCIDAWWQSGGVQEAMDPRMHNLSDGFAIIGPQSQAEKISGISTTTTQLRSDDGSTFVEVNPSTKAVRIVAPGGFTVDAPQSTFTGRTLIEGLLTYAAGLAGSGGDGATATITGIVNVIGQIIANGKRVDDTHTHTGVESGGGTSGPVA